MPNSTLRIAAWLLAYLGVALLPLTVAMLGTRPPPRGLMVETGAMLGLLGLGVLAAQLVISGRHRWFAAGTGQDNLLQFHRRTGTFGWLLVLAHPTLLMLGDAQYLAWLDPREGAMRSAAMIVLVLSATVLVVSSLWREPLRLQYETWRTLHAALSLIVVAGGLGHALMGAHHTAGLPTQLALVVVVGVPLALLLEARVSRPWRLRRRPWRVLEVEPRRAQSTRIVLGADGHPGMAFRPGQYAWLTLGDTPFSLQQHPFSMSSSPTDPARLEFLVKLAGDFTGTLPDTEPGTTAFLEGPYGVFVMDVEANRRAVFVAGGIGITPILSMSRACRDHGHSQPMWLLYGNEDEDSIVAREAVESLAAALSLTLVHVLADPSGDWKGERGYIDTDLLERVLPPDAADIDYFICGPEPLMDKVEPAMKSRGIDTRRVHSERFDLV
jgi:predicted ferric reductase